MKQVGPSIQNFCEKKQKSAFAIMCGLLMTMVAIFTFFLSFPGLFRVPVIFVQFILTGFIILAYSIFVPMLKEDEKTCKKCKLVLRLSFILALTFLVSAPVRALQNKTKSSAMLSVWLIFTAIVVLLSIVFVCGSSANKLYEKLEKGLFTAFGSKKVVNPGDIVLCDIKEEVLAKAKDPREILPAKDRFLHMLILGPTGCGKTSQIILPMVRQDIQNPEWGITVLEPKGDLAIKAAMMAEHYGRPCVYFDPTYKNCKKFNPLAGREIDVVENIATTFKMLNPDSPQFFLDLNEQLVRNAVKVLKRLDRDAGIEGKFATLINLGRLLQNSGGQGREMVNNFSRISAPTDSEAKENADIATWFLNDYFPERSKVYENTSGVRSQVSKLVSNEYLREVLNPDIDKGEKNEVNFDKHLMEGGIICISTAQGALRDLSKYLGYFIILSLQSSVFRRPGNENTRRPHSLYIDEFQTYSTPGFADMLTQGRSYRVSSILATQARAQMAMGGGRDGKNFVELVSANARNVILFPGLNKDDAKYYSETFGEYEKTEVMTGYSRKRFNLITGGLDRLGHPTESIREQQKMTPNFTATDLIFGQDVGSSFGEIAYCIIKNNSVQPAKVGRISYIPKDLNDKLDARIAEYSEQYARESAADFYAHEGEQKNPQDSNAADDELVFFGDNDSPGNDGLDDLGGGEDNLAFTPPAEPTQSPQDEAIERARMFAERPAGDDPDPLYFDAEETGRREEDDSDLIDNTGNLFDGIDDDLV